MTTKTYESQAKIFVRLGLENVGLDPTTTLGEGAVVTTPTSREAEINSVVHMIRSRNLHDEIVEEFGAEQILRGTPDAELGAVGVKSNKMSVAERVTA